jgi:hypothetical protein
MERIQTDENNAQARIALKRVPPVAAVRVDQYDDGCM